MKLDKKKKLAAETFNVGLGRVAFNPLKLDEIKEAITKQDIRDLERSGAVIIKRISGRKGKGKRKTKKREGKIRKKIKKRKREYMTLTRKFRSYLGELKSQNKINLEKYYELRKQIKTRMFKNKRQLQDFIKRSIK